MKLKDFSSLTLFTVFASAAAVALSRKARSTQQQRRLAPLMIPAVGGLAAFLKIFSIAAMICYLLLLRGMLLLLDCNAAPLHGECATNAVTPLATVACQFLPARTLEET